MPTANLACWFNSTKPWFRNQNHFNGFAETTKEVQKKICSFMFYRKKTLDQHCPPPVVIIRGIPYGIKTASEWQTSRNNQKLVAHLKRLLCLSSLFIFDRSKKSSLNRLPHDCIKHFLYFLGGDANRYPNENFKLIHFFTLNAENIEKNMTKFKHPTFLVSNDRIDLIDEKGCNQLFKLI